MATPLAFDIRADTPTITHGRDPISASLRSVAAQRTRQSSEPLLWYDTHQVAPGSASFELLTRGLQWQYTGVICYPDQYRDVMSALPRRVLTILDVRSVLDVPSRAGNPEAEATVDVIASDNLDVLACAAGAGYQTCLRMRIDARPALEQCITIADRYDYVAVSFQDPTNIPLELIIATLQGSDTRLVKEIASPEDVDDAIVALGVMEVGAAGVVYTPRSHDQLSDLIGRIEARACQSVKLQVATVVRSEALGMGTRCCIDATTLYSPTEGLLVGSTSSGGILCCPEVFFLPYMELRPFRVNAGAVHSYVFNFGDRTNYMSELRTGRPIMVVDSGGRTRKAYIGRVKTEVRPLRLIEVEFESGSHVSVILQDDWHVRVFSDQATPLNITHLKPGDRVIGYPTEPGRHVGIRVCEQILEA